MFLRGFTISHECIRQWEAKLLPMMGEALRKRRSLARAGTSTNLPEGPGPLGYLYRSIAIATGT
jgi:hypothetical protein